MRPGLARLMEENRIADVVHAKAADQTILRRCLAGRLPKQLGHDLLRAIGELRGPLAVRSSTQLDPDGAPTQRPRHEQGHLAVRTLYRTSVRPSIERMISIRTSESLSA